MGWMSPQELHDDPKRWLSIPHELHDSLLPLMVKLFPDFEDRLRSAQVHCLECEGHKPFEVVTVDGGELKKCNGYIGDSSVELVHLVDP